VSIFHQTLSEEAFRGARFQCSGSIAAEFESAAQDLDKMAKTKLLLRGEFSIQKKYRLVALSRTTPALHRTCDADQSMQIINAGYNTEF
jgi:hypothetical protein